MDKTVLDKLLAIKTNQKIAHVSFFNNGKIRRDEFSSAKRINSFNNKDDYKAITDVLISAAESYSRSCPFDTIMMNLELGLIYNNDDVHEDNTLKTNAKPIENIVRYYTGSISSFLEGQKTNLYDYDRIGLGRQNYIDYNKLKELVENSGLMFIGPNTFEEFKKKITSGERFNILISADLKEKDNKNSYIK